MKKIFIFTLTIVLMSIINSQGQVRPAEDYPELFKAVQLNRVFSDSKTFVDCSPRKDPQVLREIYKREKPQSKAELQAFVEKYFEIPDELPVKVKTSEEVTAASHINRLWPILTKMDSTQDSHSTRIALPHPYIVPGGRFREIFYWDSYFTMLGLQEAGRPEMIRNMVENFAWLIKQYGKIPNGNRTYFLSRSQPPFFSAMIDLLAQEEGDSVYVEFLPALAREYNFWMDGRDKLQGPGSAYLRVVQLSEQGVLNRYWDNKTKPRPESYLEDMHLARQANRDKEQLYRDLRAACESGWDFSARWLNDGRSLATIHTTDIVPVDLNSLLFHLEKTLSKAYKLAGKQEKSRELDVAGEQRRKAIERYCYSEDAGFYVDYNFRTEEPTGVLSLAGTYPLFFEVASQQRAADVQHTLGLYFVFNGGVVSTLRLTQQQWDTPNGWAPLHWMTIKGLRNYGFNQLARTIAKSWMQTNERVFENSGKMMEKYNVICQGLENGGGEYPTQDGFGWTNGVYLKLKALYDK